jgi:hypothetical protein
MEFMRKLQTATPHAVHKPTMIEGEISHGFLRQLGKNRRRYSYREVPSAL